jgi:hypothetical protein
MPWVEPAGAFDAPGSRSPNRTRGWLCDALSRIGARSDAVLRTAMGRSAIMSASRVALCNCQTARRSSSDVHHRPCSHLGAGLAVLFSVPSPHRGVRNDWANDRARGARMFCMRAPRMTSLQTPYGGPARRSKGNDTRGGPAQALKGPLEPDRLGSRSSPAFRTRMGLSAC